MKMVSYPPFIVFFDTIAVILFLLIMNQHQRLIIEIKGNSLFTDAEIIYKKNNRYLRTSGEEYKPKKGEGDFYYFMDCEQRIFECREAFARYKTKDVYILLPEPVYNDIAKLTVLAFGTKICTGVKYSIAKMGQIDYQQLQKDNPCLHRMPGFDERVKKMIEFSKT